MALGPAEAGLTAFAVVLVAFGVRALGIEAPRRRQAHLHAVGGAGLILMALSALLALEADPQHGWPLEIRHLLMLGTTLPVPYAVVLWLSAVAPTTTARSPDNAGPAPHLSLHTHGWLMLVTWLIFGMVLASYLAARLPTTEARAGALSLGIVATVVAIAWPRWVATATAPLGAAHATPMWIPRAVMGIAGVVLLLLARS